jgi:protease-4
MRKLRNVIIGVVIASLAASWLFGDDSPPIPDGSVLVMSLAGSYVESTEPPLLTRILAGRARPFAALLSELKKAERDDRLSTVVFRVRTLKIGWGQAQELRDAISRLSAAGRQTIVFLEVEGFGANLEYYVASAADEIYVSPAAGPALVGLSGEYFFLGQAWRNLGVDFDVARAGQYKSAVETLTGDEMSDAYREVANSILDSINGQFISGVAQGRDLTEDFVRRAIDQAPSAPADLRKLSLIDEIEFFDVLLSSLGGTAVREETYARVELSSVGFDPVASFALIYGSGNVVVGSGGKRATGAPVLASDTVVAAIESAVKDPKIQAIIFRINSPGGSALASDIVWRAMEIAKRSGKPLIASLSNVAASGGYYVASAADSIVAPPGCFTGSIGVFAIRPTFEGLLDKLDIRVERIARGAHADLRLASKPLSPETAQLMQDSVDAVYELFVDRVASGRGMAREEVEKLAQGRVWTGEQALERGLIDGLGGLTEAVLYAKRAVGLEADADVSLVPYPPPGSLLEQLSETLQTSAPEMLPSASLPALAALVQGWIDSAPIGVPALIPPFVLDIR